MVDPTPISYVPVVNAVLELGAAAVTAVGSVAIAKLVQWLNLKNGTAARSALDDVLTKSVTFGLAESQDIIKARGWDHVDVKNAALARALPYLIDRFPDVLRAAKLDPASPATERKMQDALLRALPHAALIASNSPATPPTTAPNPPVQSALQPPAAQA